MALCGSKSHATRLGQLVIAKHVEQLRSFGVPLLPLLILEDLAVAAAQGTCIDSCDLPSLFTKLTDISLLPCETNEITVDRSNVIAVEILSLMDQMLGTKKATNLLVRTAAKLIDSAISDMPAPVPAAVTSMINCTASIELSSSLELRTAFALELQNLWSPCVHTWQMFAERCEVLLRKRLSVEVVEKLMQ